MQMYILAVFILSYLADPGTQTHFQDTEVSEKLLSYFLRAKIGKFYEYETVGVLIYDDRQNVSKSVRLCDKLLKYRWKRPAILLNLFEPPLIKKLLKNYVNSLMVFVDSETGFLKCVSYIVSTDFIRFEGPMYFLIAGKFNDRRWILPTLEYVWKQSILNFVLVYELGGVVEVVGYNPFSKKLLWNDNFEVNKMRNLYGHRISIGLTLDDMKNRLVEGKLVSRDAELAMELLRSFNASTKDAIIIYPEMFTMIWHLQIQALNVTFTKFCVLFGFDYLVNPSPVEMDYVVIILPVGNMVPQYQYLFKVFTKLLWTVLMTTLAVVMLLNSLIAGRQRVAALMTVVQIFVSTSTVSSSEPSISRKLLLMFWVYFSLLMVTAFNSELRSCLINRRYYKGAKTLEEISLSKMKIFTYEVFAKGLKTSMDIIRNNVQLTDKDYLPELNKYERKERGYVVLKSYADFFMVRKDEHGSPYYRVLDEYLSVAFMMFDYSKNSPYKSKMEHRLLEFRDFGLGSFGVRSARPESANSLIAPLTVSHLQTAFYLLFFGIFWSCFVFGVEIWDYVRDLLQIALRSFAAMSRLIS